MANRFFCPPDSAPVRVFRVSYNPMASKICFICATDERFFFKLLLSKGKMHHKSFVATYPNLFIRLRHFTANFQVGREMHGLHDGDERLQFVVLHDVCGLTTETFQYPLASIYRYVTMDIFSPVCGKKEGYISFFFFVLTHHQNECVVNVAKYYCFFFLWQRVLVI